MELCSQPAQCGRRIRKELVRAAHSRERTIVKTSGKIMLAVAIIGAVGAIIARQLPKTERSYH